MKKVMKVKLAYFTFIIILIAFISSCNKEDSTSSPIPPADPDGTITMNLSMEVDSPIWSGIAEKPYQNYPYMFIGFHMTNILNTCFNTTVCPDAGNPHGENFYNSGGEAVNMGSVDGLGSVTTKPNSGYSKTCAFEKGHGYVIRFRKSYDQEDPALPYYYGRYYVVDWLLDIYGGIAGAKIKYQGLF